MFTLPRQRHTASPCLILSLNCVASYSQKKQQQNFAYLCRYSQKEFEIPIRGILGTLNPKTNVCKLANGVFTIKFAYFHDGRQVEELKSKCVKLVQINAQHIFSWLEVLIDINLCN